MKSPRNTESNRATAKSKDVSPAAPAPVGAARQSGASNPDYLTRDEVLAILGIKPQTLYAYVSRGLIHSVPQPDGRSSFYLGEDVERIRVKSAARAGFGAVAASAASVNQWPRLSSSTFTTTSFGTSGKRRKYSSISPIIDRGFRTALMFPLLVPGDPSTVAFRGRVRLTLTGGC